MIGLGQTEALVYLPLLLPLCFYVVFTDLSQMRITNQAVVALACVFLVIGPIVLPFDAYIWRIAQGAMALVAGFILASVGAVGAGDAKFTASAALFIAPQDIGLVLLILAASLLAAVVTHRAGKYAGLHALAPHWESWHRTSDFPMGFSLAGTLAMYLLLGATFGA